MEQILTVVERLVTARVVSEAMGMAASQVYRLAKQSKIPFYVVGERGGGVRFSLSEVKKALARPVKA